MLHTLCKSSLDKHDSTSWGWRAAVILDESFKQSLKNALNSLYIPLKASPFVLSQVANKRSFWPIPKWANMANFRPHLLYAFALVLCMIVANVAADDHDKRDSDHNHYQYTYQSPPSPFYYYYSSPPPPPPYYYTSPLPPSPPPPYLYICPPPPPYVYNSPPPPPPYVY
ncbi:hypothetical protein RJ641_007366 [Dillenia turbinata]|uniref:Uncharacterized protein n=1 Tax=Dillenia turbinata TaxID=194707 RepID=A0AAN8VDU4_9MAGN